MSWVFCSGLVSVIMSFWGGHACICGGCQSYKPWLRWGSYYVAKGPFALVCQKMWRFLQRCVFFVGVLVTRALLLWVYIKAPDFGNSHILRSSHGQFS